MKYLLAFSLLIFSVQIAFSQEAVPSDVPEEYQHGIGFSANSVSGIGLSYRYWPAKTGIQFSFLPVIGEFDTWISAGVAGLYSIKKNQKVNLYGFLGIHYLYADGDASLNTGIGPGFEFILGEVVGLNLEFGYGIYGGQSISTNIAGGLSLYYKL